MARRLTVVVSQAQSKNPAKRDLEEGIVAALLMERGIEVTVIPHLYDLKADSTGMLCLKGISGDMVICSWLFPRAAHWILDRNQVHGHEGTTLLVDDDLDEEDELADEELEGADDGKERVIDQREIPNRRIYCLDLRARNKPAPFVEEIKRIASENATQVVGLMDWISGAPAAKQTERFLAPTNDTALGGVAPPESNRPPSSAEPTAATSGDDDSAAEGPRQAVRIEEAPARRWYPVIDYGRCTNCMECVDFCLFGVYGVDNAETILVEQPDNCRKGCPACSRVCPENAIIFPQHKTPTIAGSPEVAGGGLKIDLSQLFGGGGAEEDALEVAARERDEQLAIAGRETVGMTVGIPKRQEGKADGPKDALDSLMDELDDLDL